MMNTQYRDRWDANLYDGKHSFVSAYGADVVSLLNPQKGERILDIGCGTGDLAKKLFDLGVSVEGVDKSENMVLKAQKKYPELHFHACDAVELKYDNEFDAIFSNATLHWIKPAREVLNCIYNSLKKEGRFVAEFGGKGNVEAITSEMKNQFQLLGLSHFDQRFPWYFPSIAEYTSLMEEMGFEVTYAHLFDRPTQLDGENGLRNWIEMFGKLMFEGFGEETINTIIMNTENNLKERMFQGQNWLADYKRIRVIGIKK